MKIGSKKDNINFFLTYNNFVCGYLLYKEKNIYVINVKTKQIERALLGE